MVRVHLVTGNKGNVGKSAFSSAVIEYYRHHEKGLIVMDCDKDSQTLSKCYQGSMVLSLSDNPALASQPDMILQVAFKESQKEGERSDVLVDLPAGGEKQLNHWLNDCGVEEFSLDAGVTFYKWWVCDSDPHSMELFQESFAAYPKIKHVFVKNMGRSYEHDWQVSPHMKAIDDLLSKDKIRTMEIPRLLAGILKALREEGLELNDVVEDIKYELFDVTTRLRVNSWLSHIHNSLGKMIKFKSKEASTELDETVVPAEQEVEVTVVAS